MCSIPDTLKDGPAERVIIHRPAQMAGTYNMAIECLLSRCDQPHLIHDAHICAILHVPSLKEGNEKELRRFHDVVLQHY